MLIEKIYDYFFQVSPRFSRGRIRVFFLEGQIRLISFSARICDISHQNHTSLFCSEPGIDIMQNAMVGGDKKK